MLKRTGFKKISFADAVAKKQKDQKKRLASKKPMQKTRKKNKKKTSLQLIKDNCDSKLTPIIKKLYPACLLCGDDTQVAHHHIKKSKSAILRYCINNLVPLCNKCHFKLHRDEIFYSSKVIQIMGVEWFNELEKEKNKIIQVNMQWYRDNLERLNNLLSK